MDFCFSRGNPVMWFSLALARWKGRVTSHWHDWYRDIFFEEDIVKEFEQGSLAKTKKYPKEGQYGALQVDVIKYLVNAVKHFHEELKHTQAPGLAITFGSYFPTAALPHAPGHTLALPRPTSAPAHSLRLPLTSLAPAPAPACGPTRAAPVISYATAVLSLPRAPAATLPLPPPHAPAPAPAPTPAPNPIPIDVLESHLDRRINASGYIYQGINRVYQVLGNVFGDGEGMCKRIGFLP